MTPDVLILAAFDPELAPFRSALGDDFAATIAGRCITARVAGIGLPSAAVGAAMHIAELRPRAVVLVGTCGAYATSGLAIGDSVVARRLRLVGISSLSGQTEFPESMPVVTEAPYAYPENELAAAPQGAHS